MSLWFNKRNRKVLKAEPGELNRRTPDTVKQACDRLCGHRSALCQEILKQNNTLSACQEAILLSSFELIAKPNSDTYAHTGFNNHSSLGTVVCHPRCHDNKAVNFGLDAVTQGKRFFWGTRVSEVLTVCWGFVGMSAAAMRKASGFLQTSPRLPWRTLFVLPFAHFLSLYECVWYLWSAVEL